MATKTKNEAPSPSLGFEAKLWQGADALRNNMDAAENQHVVPGLTFLKYISDAFEAKHAELDEQREQGPDPEAPDEYRAVSINRVESRTLAALRDTLRPKVVSGELRVKDTERFPEVGHEL